MAIENYFYLKDLVGSLSTYFYDKEPKGYPDDDLASLSIMVPAPQRPQLKSASASVERGPCGATV